jgi:hypothetical protein
MINSRQAILVGIAALLGFVGGVLWTGRERYHVQTHGPLLMKTHLGTGDVWILKEGKWHMLPRHWPQEPGDQSK